MQKIIAQSPEANIHPFKEISERFLETAKTRLDKQTNSLSQSKKVFMKTLKFYKFTPKSCTVDECTPGQFFEFWASFTIDFRDLWKREIAALNNEL